MADEQDAAETGGIQTLCELPEGAVPLEVIEVCGYIQPDGTRMWTTRFSREAPLSTIVGLLSLAQHQILEESKTWD